MSIYAFVGSYIASFVKLSLILILGSKEKIFNNVKFWIAVVISGLYIYASFLITENAIKVILEFVVTIVLAIFVVNKNIKRKNIIISSFAVWVIMLLLDIIESIVVFGFTKLNFDQYKDNEILQFIVNASTFTIMSAVFLIRPMRNFIMKLPNNQIELKNKYISTVIFISVIFFSVSMYICLFNYNPIVVLIMLFIMLSVYTIIVIFTIHGYEQKNKIRAEYDFLLTNLSEYEYLIDSQRVANHENKNQLLVIKGMLKKGENAEKYINSLINEQYEDSESLMMKTNIIPSGGLKGLIYYKILIMKEKNINVGLEISRNIININFENISTIVNQELCKIIGVFLDNAIQEVEQLPEKNINIVIENNSKELYIKISNNYGISNPSKIGEKGYTTKGKSHGYGLKLVKKIIKNSNRFVHQTEVNGKMFSQILILQINKK